MNENVVIGSYVFCRDTPSSPIGVLTLNADRSISGGSIYEAEWEIQGEKLLFKALKGQATTTFKKSSDRDLWEGEFHLEFDGRRDIRHLLRPLGDRRSCVRGFLPTVTDDIATAQALNSKRNDFSFIVAPSEYVKHRAEVATLDACKFVSARTQHMLVDGYTSDPVFLHVLHDAAIYNGTIVSMRSGEVAYETTYQAELRSRALKHAAHEKGDAIYLPKVDKTIKHEGAAFLFNTLLGNFAHFHMQSLVNVQMLGLAKSILGSELSILSVSPPGVVPGDHGEPFRRPALKSRGIDMSQMSNPLYEDGVCHVYETLLVPSTHRMSENAAFPVYFADALRTPSKTPHVSQPKRRFLLSRADAGNSRNITNFDELSAELSSLGFEELLIGTLPYDEQFSILAEAEFIVSAHGGNMTNMLGHPGGLKVFELTHSGQVNGWFRNLAGICGHRYGFYCADPDFNEWYSPFTVDVGLVRKSIEKML